MSPSSPALQPRRSQRLAVSSPPPVPLTDILEPCADTDPLAFFSDTVLLWLQAAPLCASARELSAVRCLCSLGLNEASAKSPEPAAKTGIKDSMVRTAITKRVITKKPAAKPIARTTKCIETNQPRGRPPHICGIQCVWDRTDAIWRDATTGEPRR